MKFCELRPNGGLVDNSGASGTRIEGNYIGTDSSGTADLGNSAGSVFLSEGSDNVVAGTSAETRNVNSGNDGTGVSVSGVGATGSRASSATPSSTMWGGDQPPKRKRGFQRRDPQRRGKDADIGPNNLLNRPVLTSVTASGGQTILQGTLNSTPGAPFTI